ncbi:MAG: bifunctional adenosylcobinamide kinase/adenosylcobinamide-phosphate guanylyltransferase [Acidobacteriia bacterium]|nr:bifunctional adenosylcobinamide kinase/adenosylcobinamide-phosphate guanylyltransferase [Terriglobia bacterium]
MLTLIIGGARSGKSRFAQSLCTSGRIAFVATARAEDEEMQRRIVHHRQARPRHWLTIEEPLALASAIRNALPCADTFLIDCLTLWLSNLMWEQRESPPDEIERTALSEIDELADLCADRALIVVSNEVGGGLVPESEVGRRFRDLQGTVNQRCAALADRVFLTVAGIAIPIKPAATL